MERGIEVFNVLEPGILTTVQDRGRFGYSRIGVPRSGALDAYALRSGNLLVGNAEGAAGLESTLTGPKLQATRDVLIAITGGDLFPLLNGEPLAMWRSHLLVEGDLLVLKGVRKGCRAYIAISGGVCVPEVMGSRSTFLSGRFGGLEGRALRKGDVLQANDVPIPFRRIGIRFPEDGIPRYGSETALKVVPGPQDRHFSGEGLQVFQSSSYRVTARSDRMGIRLDGPAIQRHPGAEESIISESLIPGAIQVPGDGKPIIILNELVTGGYTKIATIPSAELPRVAQLKPGDPVRFEPIPVEEAHRLLKEQEAHLQRFRESLSPL